jgi:hypothetical protein
VTDGCARRMGGARQTVIAVLLPGLLAGALSAQTTAFASGRVVRLNGPDTLPVAGATVILHRVGHDRQGPIDSLRAGPAGQFQFRFPIDTSVVYLLSSGYAGIEYFSTPLHVSPVHPDSGLRLIVSDTSAAAPVAVQSRHIVISKPAADGTRSALEIVVLANAGQKTRVSDAKGTPTWGTRLPAGVLNFQVGPGDVSSDAVEEREDSVVLFAPIAPGEKQLVYTYLLPQGPGTVRFPIGDSIEALTVMLEEFDRTPRGGGLVKGDSVRVESRTFRQWSGAVSPGVVISIEFPGSPTGWILPLLVGTVALGLVVALVAVLRRRPAPAAETAPEPLEALARLDARFAGREADVSPAEWTRYQEERARLKAEVAAQLAARGVVP